MTVGEQTQALIGSAAQQFEDSLQYNGTAYSVAASKKSSLSSLQNNLPTALRRLGSKTKELQKCPDSYARYNHEVMAFVKEAHAEEIFSVNVNAPEQCDGSYVIPHH